MIKCNYCERSKFLGESALNRTRKQDEKPGKNAFLFVFTMRFVIEWGGRDLKGKKRDNVVD